MLYRRLHLLILIINERLPLCWLLLKSTTVVLEVRIKSALGAAHFQIEAVVHADMEVDFLRNVRFEAVRISSHLNLIRVAEA